MLTVLFIFAIWFMLAVPIVVLVGGVIRYGEGD
jgi:hypothetical protein